MPAGYFCRLPPRGDDDQSNTPDTAGDSREQKFRQVPRCSRHPWPGPVTVSSPLIEGRTTLVALAATVSNGDPLCANATAGTNRMRVRIGMCCGRLTLAETSLTPSTAGFLPSCATPYRRPFRESKTSCLWRDCLIYSFVLCDFRFGPAGVRRALSYRISFAPRVHGRLRAHGEACR